MVEAAYWEQSSVDIPFTPIYTAQFCRFSQYPHILKFMDKFFVPFAARHIVV